MMRYYGLSDTEALDMPVTRFLVLHERIVVLQAEEELRDLLVAHHQKPGERAKELVSTISKHQTRKQRSGPRTIDLIGTVAPVAAEAEPGSIAAERQRQREAAERMRREWEAKRSR